jgi:Tfp pilus assembly protein PilF
MSLLADLLSKNKTGSSPDGKEAPSPLNVPPTLSKAHGIPSQVRKIKNRYVIIALVLLAFVAIGVFVSAKFGTPGKTAPKPTKTLQQPTSAKVVLTGEATQQGVVAPPSAPQPVEQVNKARITLGEPSEPTPTPSPEPRKKKVRPLKAKSPKCPACPPPQAAVAAKPVAARLPQKNDLAPAQARQKLAAPLKIDTATRDSLLYAARSAEQISDWKSALASYRKAQAIDPENFKIMSNVAAVLNNLGLFDDGAQEAERALAKKPDYVPALINAAIGNSSKGDSQKALRYFTYASALDPGNRSLVINLGILQERTGKLDDAQATYRQLANAGDPQALQGMGRVYERKGNRSEAIRTYRQLMALPGVSPALRKEAKGKLVGLEE